MAKRKPFDKININDKFWVQCRKCGRTGQYNYQGEKVESDFGDRLFIATCSDRGWGQEGWGCNRNLKKPAVKVGW